MNALKLAEEWKDRADDCGKLARAILASSAIAPATDAYKEAVAMNLKLRKALEQCVLVCREWHAMPKTPNEDDAFDLYFNHSPEMKLIRDVLGKMPEPA